MPTLANHIILPSIENVMGQKCIRSFADYDLTNYGWLFFINGNNNSKDTRAHTLNDLLISSADKKFIQFNKSFTEQFNFLAASFSNLDFNIARTKMHLSLNKILELNPTAFSMELTNEQSIFYTIKKEDYTFYLQHFLNEIDEDEDESILTIFNGNNKLPSYAGSLFQTFVEIDNLMAPSNTFKSIVELYEISR